MPIGPNGVSAFDTLAPSPLSKPEIAAGMISYDYTLNHQGLKSNVSCSYTTTYPFSSFAVLDPIGFPTTTLTYNVNCTGQGKTDALINLPPPESAITHDALIYWACQDEIPTASYTIYLAGFGGYNNTVGNVTCVINPIQSAIYSVMYRSTEDIFSVTEANASSPIRFSTLINDALVGLRKLISNSQNFDDNLLAEMILDFGLKSFGLPADPDLPPPQYLSIYEQMIQGIIEYEVCPVNYFIPFLSLIFCHLTDDLPSVDLFDTSRCPFLLQSHGDWPTEIRGIRLVHDECQHRLFDPNNDRQPGRLVRSLSSYGHRERWWLRVSSIPDQTSHI